MSRRDCLLCGATDQETAFLVVRWRKPIGEQLFAAMPRCVDRAGCRARVEARGDEWEVADAGDRTGGEVRGSATPRLPVPLPRIVRVGSGSDAAPDAQPIDVATSPPADAPSLGELFG